MSFSSYSSFLKTASATVDGQSEYQLQPIRPRGNLLCLPLASPHSQGSWPIAAHYQKTEPQSDNGTTQIRT
ncbi:hypothetical protein SKAU_G00210280 [Synaphobranchus kaupii]|uniref:Uncharacterized protein n=1 Tax=Synaphobranchus kaupii TaxID=118154 RepID=A0A9Q1IUU9_SYNKA|nr:hypothetical protein SKAU_G00210280 [Synaphobranchus kaupii]